MTNTERIANEYYDRHMTTCSECGCILDNLYAEKTEQEFHEKTQLVKVSDNWSDVADFVQDK